MQPIAKPEQQAAQHVCPSAERLIGLLGSHPSGQQLAALLVSLGSAVCAAMPTCNYPACNYPTRTNCDQLSEPQLVEGKVSTFSGCKSARYCCVQQQHEHWKQHRAGCKALAGSAPDGAGKSSRSSSDAGPKMGKAQVLALMSTVYATIAVQ